MAKVTLKNEDKCRKYSEMLKGTEVGRTGRAEEKRGNNVSEMGEL